MLISQDEPRALIYQRDEHGRLEVQAARLVDGVEGAIVPKEFDILIPFSALYEGLDSGPASSRSV